MSYSTVPTVLTGDTWTATQHNTYIKDNFADVVAYKGVKVIRTSNQAMTGVMANVLFDSEDHDTDGFHSTVSNTDRLVVPAGFAGYYQVYGHVMWAGGSGDNEVDLQKNGTIIHHTSSPSAAAGSADYLACVVYLAVGDYVTLSCGTTNSKNVEAVTGSLYFGMHLVRS